jgi:hypothetical protein
MRELRALVAEGRVAHVIVWRLDRLSRDSGDFATLTRSFESECVQLHSVNDGDVELGTASGRLQLGIHGVLAQYYREQLVENVRMGMEQAARSGRWLNRPPTGYDLRDGRLVANDDAPMVRHVFKLRADGLSYGAIEEATGVRYSTVRQIIHNRVYLGLVRLRDEWFPGLHEPLVSEAEWDAAHRGHVPGRRRGRDVLSGRVRCGLCRRIVSIDYNQKGQPLFRCKHRGKGCDLPGRSSSGLQRAAVLGLSLVAQDEELQTAIRSKLRADVLADSESDESVKRDRAIARLVEKRRKLLDLHYNDQISSEAFGEEESRLAAQIEALRTEATAVRAARAQTDELADRFDEVAALLAEMDVAEVWAAATDAERRVLVEDLLDAIYVHPDWLVVHVNGAPPLLVTLAEVGLRESGSTRTCVSEGGLEPPCPEGH